jgi:hypothetical protein
MVLIDSLYVLFSYVDKDGEIWTVAFASTKKKEKNITSMSWLFYVLDFNDSDEDSTVD